MFSRLTTLLFVVALISTGNLFAAEKGWFDFRAAIAADTVSGLQFFDKVDKDVALRPVEAKAYKAGTVALRYEVRGASVRAVEAGS